MELHTDIWSSIALFDPEVATSITLLCKKLNSAIRDNERLWWKLMNIHYYPCEWKENGNWRRRVINLIRRISNKLWNAVTYDEAKAFIHRGDALFREVDRSCEPSPKDDVSVALFKCVDHNDLMMDRIINNNCHVAIVAVHLDYCNLGPIRAIMETEEMFIGMKYHGISMNELFVSVGARLNYYEEGCIEKIVACEELLFNAMNGRDVVVGTNYIGSYIAARYRMTGISDAIGFLKNLSFFNRLIDMERSATIEGIIIPALKAGDEGVLDYLMRKGYSLREIPDNCLNFSVRSFAIPFFDYLVRNNYGPIKKVGDPGYDYINVLNNYSRIIPFIKTNDLSILDHIISTLNISDDENLLTYILKILLSWCPVKLDTIRYLVKKYNILPPPLDMSLISNIIINGELLLRFVIEEMNADYEWSSIGYRDLAMSGIDREILHHLIRLGIRFSMKDVKEIFMAEELCDVETFKLLLDSGIDPQSIFKVLSAVNEEMEKLEYETSMISDDNVCGKDRKEVLQFLRKWIKD